MESLHFLKQHSWQDLQETVSALEPKLADLINELEPDKNHSLYVATYPYGEMILQNGVFRVPNSSGETVTLTDHSIPSYIREDLNYNGTMPVGIISKNIIESFFVWKDRVLPSTLFNPGEMIALWRILDEGLSYQGGNYWNVSSGARTICMLPKVTDKNSYRMLKIKYGLKLPIPRFLREHWHIFTHLANHKLFSQPWGSEIIFFSQKWFSHKKDKAWSDFYYYLTYTVWSTSAFIRNQFIFNFILSVIQENRNLKPSPYLVDTVKHLISIGVNTIPGLAPAVDNSCGPISGLQKIFLEDYGLKKYAPIIIHSQHFCLKNPRSVYYSLQIPTTMSFSPKSNRASNAMSEVRELKYVMEVVFTEIINGNLGINKTPLFELANQVTYSFYHTDKDIYNEIFPSENLSLKDPYFSKTLLSDEKYTFPEFSPFLRGCVSISSI